ncbi:site-specific integrase [Streptomyces sp. SPB162]|uniref:tyrosine-type recombinase/integrase n=1 Tax=Streptomyces sp. SPB162 TaxID=2940560 RepID=UPI00240672DA|nr:site-specific integrase [Streptomyces sp. SPB162]MDF9817213.1 integrase [Streptomyces sp. SPB162]
MVLWTLYGWIADECGRSTVKNSLAVLVRVMEQAEDELDDPRTLALPNWPALTVLATALVARSHGNFAEWGEVAIFMACTAARIGEASGVRVKDIDPVNWIWTVRRQTTPSPGGLADKGTKGKAARRVPLIEEVRPLIAQRLLTAGPNPDARLFTGPRGGRITTAVLRDATHWDAVVSSLSHEKLRRHSLRHTGLTWMADAGMPLHVLRLIAGHGSLLTTQRYLHPDLQAIVAAGRSLSAHLVLWPERFTGSRRPARHFAAWSESSEYARYEDDPPPCDAPRRTPPTRQTLPARALAGAAGPSDPLAATLRAL